MIRLTPSSRWKVKFLIDRCAGHRLAEWLRQQGHDVVQSRERGPDPRDRILLAWAASEQRILVTMDKDFGEFIFQDVPLIEGWCGYRTYQRRSVLSLWRKSSIGTVGIFRNPRLLRSEVDGSSLTTPVVI